MLKRLDKKHIISLDKARVEYPKTKKIFIITDRSDVSNIQGYISIISEDDSSFSDLLKANEKLYTEGVETIVIGSYENGGAIGVQYEI